jgi:hypothetical protein
MNIQTEKQNWFQLYKGLIYGNKATDIITKIHNKQNIEKQLNNK